MVQRYDIQYYKKLLAICEALKPHILEKENDHRRAPIYPFALFPIGTQAERKATHEDGNKLSDLPPTHYPLLYSQLAYRPPLGNIREGRPCRCIFFSISFLPILYRS